MIHASVVLANLMDRDGSLNAETIARINCAVAHDSVAMSRFILLCGWAYREDSEMAIADAMHKYIMLRHPSLASRVICQRLSRDTVGDALFSRIYLDRLMPSNDYSVTVFTSNYHAERSSEIFNFFFCNHALVSVVGVEGFESEALKQKEIESLRKFHNTFQDVPPGDAQRALSTLREKHPFYNGQMHATLVGIDNTQLDFLPELDSQ